MRAFCPLEDTFILPILQKRRQAPGLIIENRSPDVDVSKESDESDSLQSCAQEILNAIKADDAQSLASAIRSAVEIIDAAPHVEGEHTNEET